MELTLLTHATITDPAGLQRELETVRSEEVAYSRQEQFEGLAAVAAPVFRSNGSVPASITIMYLNIHSGPIDLPALKHALWAASDELSTCLGFQRGGFMRALA